jgi:hypothetical protein
VVLLRQTFVEETMEKSVVLMNMPPRIRALLGDELFYRLTVIANLREFSVAALTSSNESRTPFLVGLTSTEEFSVVPQTLRSRGFVGPIIGVCTIPRDSLAEEHELLERRFLAAGGTRLVRAPWSTQLLEAVIVSTKQILSREHDISERPEIIFASGRIRIVVPQHRVFVDSNRARLSISEFKLLAFLGERPGVFFSREQVSDALALNENIYPRAIDSCIRRIRREIKRVAGTPLAFIETKYGVGYSAEP